MSLSANQSASSSGKKLRQKLSSEWSVFIGVICNPWVLILIALIIALIICSVKLNIPGGPVTSAPPVSSAASRAVYLQAFLAVMISIFSGLVGAILASRWTEAGETSVLVTRGKSAIRGLKLLLSNLTSAEGRAAKYLETSGNEPDDELVKLSYEEIIERYHSLQEETINAIEEWQDIIPEANITTQIGVITQLQADLVEKSSAVQEAKKELSEAQQASVEEKQALQKRLQKNEQELAAVRVELSKKENELSQSGFGSLSGVTIPAKSGYSGYSGPHVRQCSSCKKYYFGDGACPSCGDTPPSLQSISGGPS
jgi:rubrerythrin